MGKTSKAIIAVPHVSFEAVKKVINALYVHKKSGSAKDLTKLAKLNPTNTSKALSIARSLGLAIKTGKGVYQLTENGSKFAQFVGFKKEQDAKNLLKKLILANKEWEEIINFLKDSIGKTRDPLDLILHIESKRGKPWSSSMRTSLAEMYKSYLVYANLIDPKKKDLVTTLVLSSQETDKEDRSTTDEESEPSDIQPEIHSEYVTFSLPNILVMQVKKSKKAFEFLKTQVHDDSDICKWIDLVIRLMEEEKQ